MAAATRGTGAAARPAESESVTGDSTTAPLRATSITLKGSSARSSEIRDGGEVLTGEQKINKINNLFSYRIHQKGN